MGTPSLGRQSGNYARASRAARLIQLVLLAMGRLFVLNFAPNSVLNQRFGRKRRIPKRAAGTHHGRRRVSRKAQARQTIQMRDANGGFGVVLVDITKSDNIRAIQVQIAPSEKPEKADAAQGNQ